MHEDKRAVRPYWVAHGGLDAVGSPQGPGGPKLAIAFAGPTPLEKFLFLREIFALSGACALGSGSGIHTNGPRGHGPMMFHWLRGFHPV